MLPITPYQIVVPLICLVAILYAWNFVMRQKKTIWEASLWTLFWGGIAAFAMFPELLDHLTRVTGIKSRENAFLVTVLGILIFVVFYLVIRIEELEQRQTRMIRKVGLREAGLKEGEDVDAH